MFALRLSKAEDNEASDLHQVPLPVNPYKKNLVQIPCTQGSKFREEALKLQVLVVLSNSEKYLRAYCHSSLPRAKQTPCFHLFQSTRPTQAKTEKPLTTFWLN